MSKLISFSKLGVAHDAPRLWVEGSRLTTLGFSPGTPIAVEIRPQGLVIAPSILSDRLISSRRSAGSVRPILDLNSHRLLSHLSGFEEMKVTGSFGQLVVSPSVRAFNISRSLNHTGPLRVLDVFCGGGTLSDSLSGNPAFKVVAAVEIDPDFADEYSLKHPEADIFQGDFRSIQPEELPEFDFLCAGLPCSDHSNFGRARKGLAGKPELGEFGDLYITLLGLISARLPLGLTLENVANFGASLAGMTIVSHLRRLGYSVHEEILKPNEQWNEPTTRDRWVCVATLRPGFAIKSPGIQFSGRISDYLDAPDFVRDSEDAERISGTIAGLRRHNARHAAAGNGFSMTILNGSEQSAPVIPKSYHKINSSGFFVETSFGPRQLRKEEIARLHGQTVLTENYATAVSIMGQGVLPRVFRSIFRQLGEFLHQPRQSADQSA